MELKIAEHYVYVCSILSLTLYALAFGCVLADEHKGKKKVYYSDTKYEKSVSKASVKCSSDAWAKSFSKSKSTFVNARAFPNHPCLSTSLSTRGLGSVCVRESSIFFRVRCGTCGTDAEAIKKVCHPHWDFKWNKIVDHMYDHGEAWAKAVAEAEANAECHSSVKGKGAKAKGCAWSKASASAWSIAYANALATATADAWGKNCKCADASAYSWGEASIYQDLIADVYAQASASACVKGNDHAEAHAYIKCYAKVYAELWAHVRTDDSRLAAASLRCKAKKAVRALNCDVQAALLRFAVLSAGIRKGTC
jgi:hypothetical protein